MPLKLDFLNFKLLRPNDSIIFFFNNTAGLQSVPPLKCPVTVVFLLGKTHMIFFWVVHIPTIPTCTVVAANNEVAEHENILHFHWLRGGFHVFFSP